MRPKKREFRIYYNGGSTYTGSPELAPARGVIAIVQPAPSVNYEIVTASDFYVWRDGRWWGADKFGMMDYIIRPGWKRILIGYMITREEYDKLMTRILADRDFGNKTGWLPGEVVPDA